MNLLKDLPAASAAEHVTKLLAKSGLRIERIVSHGEASPPGFWYDQDEGEWVLLLAGAARVLIEGEREPRVLGPGDAIELPAHTRHRIEWTDPGRPTVWLAVFYPDAAPRRR
jgi:cupin 2 domain-containing protein